MHDETETVFDYGPLAGLIGTWEGRKGLDIAPEPDGTEKNPYYETITFDAAGDVTNAEQQVITALHYRQIVTRKSTGKVFHDETGYWMWDAADGVVMHSLTIPRGVAVLAGGRYDGPDSDNNVVLEVNAKLNDPDWQIIQSPFMRDNASTIGFQQRITLNGDSLAYAETTMLDIYGKRFEHTDGNQLGRVVTT